MNITIAQLTLRTLLGRRRALLLLAIPAILLLIAVIVRLTVNESSRPDAAVGILGALALGTLIPLLGLISGTGSIGPEIDDGSIIYLLAKPISRQSIVLAKVMVAIAVTTLFGALPVFVAGLIMVGTAHGLAVGFGLGALVAGIAYCALFVLLAVINRNAVVIGLIYALVWEALIGNLVPGAQALSIQQWGLSLTRAVVGSGAKVLNVSAAVPTPVGSILLLVVTIGATFLAGNKLRSLRLSNDD